MQPESNYTPFTKVESNPLWTLMFPPTTNHRYNPREFHIGMWDEWTGKVCSEHNHRYTARSSYTVTY